MADRKTMKAPMVGVLLVASACGRGGDGGGAATPLPFAEPALVAAATATATGPDGCVTFRHDPAWLVSVERRLIGFTPDPSLGPLPDRESAYGSSPKGPSAVGTFSCVNPEPEPRSKRIVDGDRNEYEALAKDAVKSFRRLGGVATESTAAADGYVITFPGTDGPAFTTMRVYVSNAARTCRLHFVATTAEMARLEGQVRAAASTMRCAD